MTEINRVRTGKALPDKAQLVFSFDTDEGGVTNRQLAWLFSVNRTWYEAAAHDLSLVPTLDDTRHLISLKDIRKETDAPTLLCVVANSEDGLFAILLSTVNEELDLVAYVVNRELVNGALAEYIEYYDAIVVPNEEGVVRTTLPKALEDVLFALTRSPHDNSLVLFDDVAREVGSGWRLSYRLSKLVMEHHNTILQEAR